MFENLETGELVASSSLHQSDFYVQDCIEPRFLVFSMLAVDREDPRNWIVLQQTLSVESASVTCHVIIHHHLVSAISL
jgi:hypothetical protein